MTSCRVGMGARPTGSLVRPASCF